MKTVKVFMVYQKVEGLVSTLYGYTKDKNIINKFMIERKADMFSIKEVHMDKYDFKCFDEARSQYRLEERGYATYEYVGSILKRTTVTLVSTSIEEMSAFIEADRISDTISEFTCYESRYFNHELMKALDMLLYYQFYKRKEVYDPFVSGVDMFDPNEGSFKIDSLGVFLYKYGHTLKTYK